MPPPEGEQRCHGVCNTGRSPTDKRLQEAYYDVDLPRRFRPQITVETRLGNDGQYLITINEEMQSHIPAYRVRPEGLAAATLVMDAPARADYRLLATDWELQNSPICIFSHRYQPILDEGDQVLAYGRVEWRSGVAHFVQTNIDGTTFDDVTIAEKGLEEDFLGNELVATIATLGGSLLIRALSRAAIVSSSRFLGIAIAEGAIDAARGVTTGAFRLAMLALRGIRARALVVQFTRRGLKVVVNIGGEGARHELIHGPQISLNLLDPLARKVKQDTIPNLIRAKGEDIGLLFGKETVDTIVSNRLPVSVDTGAIAKGAAQVMKPGGQLKMGFAFSNQQFVDEFAAQLRAAGFKSAKAQFTGPGGPIPSSVFVEAIR